MKRLPSGDNSRIARTEQWLAQQKSPLVTEVALERGDEGESAERLAVWKRDDTFAPEKVATEVDTMLVSLANELETRVSARLVWLTESGARWTSFPLKVEPATVADRYEGTAKSVLTQTQRAFGDLTGTYQKATMETLKVLGDVATTLGARLSTREARMTELEVELSKLREENARLSGQLEQAAHLIEQTVDAQTETLTELEKTRSSTSNTDTQVVQLVSRVAGQLMSGDKPAPKKRPASGPTGPEKPPEGTG